MTFQTMLLEFIESKVNFDASAAVKTDQQDALKLIGSMTMSNGWDKASKALLTVNIMLGNCSSIACELDRIVLLKEAKFIYEAIKNNKRQHGDCPNRTFILHLFGAL